MSLYDREWHLRRPIMEAAFYLLSDFKKRTAWEIFASLPSSRLDYATPKLVQSILDEEGRRYHRKIEDSYVIKEYELDPEFALFEREWENRKAVMENALSILRDGHPRTAKEIVEDRSRRHPIKQPSKREKSEVNSVLFSEGRRYSMYDEINYEHRIVP